MRNASADANTIAPRHSLDVEQRFVLRIFILTFICRTDFRHTRLRGVEESLNDIRIILLDVRSRVQSNGATPKAIMGDATGENPALRNCDDRAHKDLGPTLCTAAGAQDDPHLAPAAVVRRLCVQLSGGRRRLLEDVKDDLVQLGILGVETSKMLVTS